MHGSFINYVCNLLKDIAKTYWRTFYLLSVCGLSIKDLVKPSYHKLLDSHHAASTNSSSLIKNSVPKDLSNGILCTCAQNKSIIMQRIVKDIHEIVTVDN